MKGTKENQIWNFQFSENLLSTSTSTLDYCFFWVHTIMAYKIGGKTFLLNSFPKEHQDGSKKQAYISLQH